MARAQIIRTCADREKHLLFRGWTRMCLHAASLTDAEGASAAATASARAIRAEAMAKEATIAAKKVESSSQPTAAVEAHGSQEAADFFTLRPERTYGKERQDRRAKMLITRVCRDNDKTLLFRGWSRLCIHAASLSAAEGASAAATAVARAARAEAMKIEAVAASKKVQALSLTTGTGVEVSSLMADRMRTLERTLRREQERRVGMLMSRISSKADRSLMFRGWSRLCLHAASLSAVGGASAVATAAARAARAEAMKKEAEVATSSAKMAEIREKAQRETSYSSTLTAELNRKIERTERIVREQQLRWMKRMVARVCCERSRSLLFHGWSRLCLHAASLSAAEGASSAATATARAARAEAMEKEAKAAADKAEARRRAAAASVEVAEAREKAQRETARGSLVRVCSERDRALVFRGWSRLCLHAASLSAAEGASAAATAAARAARAEAMESEAKAAADKAEAWRRAAAASAEVAKAREKAEREAARGSITRLCGERDRTLLFRGWSRLCLHAASLSSAEGASAAATALARATRAEAMEKEAEAAAASSEIAAAKEKAQRAGAGRSMLATELERKVKDLKQVVREHRLRRMKMLITRMCGERDRALIFRGWSRLCLHAASLSAAEGASAAATAVARAARAEAMEMEAKAAIASAEIAAAREAAKKATARGSMLATALKLKVTRVCGERDRALISRGWSRLCVHAASVAAAEGGSTAATAVARAARAETMEKEAEKAAKKAEAWRRAAAASIEAVAAQERAQERAQHNSDEVSVLRTELKRKEEHTDQVAREQKLRRAKGLGASAAATAVARAARAEAMEKEAQAAPDKAEAWRRAAAASTEVAEAREKAQREAAHGSVLHAELDQTKAEVKQVVREQQLRRMKMLITRVCGERDRALVFRGWSRLCLHAASLSAAEGASAAATAVARAARAEAMEKEAQAAADKAEAWRRAAAASTEVAEAREKAQRDAAHGSVLHAELNQTKAEVKQVVREQKLRRMKMLITRVCSERDRALVFRGWSRLCLHAASLSAAEGASAAATAVARAARAEAMEKEAQAAPDKAEAWRRAAAASAEVAEAREKAQREAARESFITAELDQRIAEMEQVAREQKLRRMKMLITRVCGERDRALVFRGWSRLCLHAASLSAAEGASAAATAVARAARAEAMEKEAQVAPDKAEAWRRAAAASTEVAEAREKAQREAAHGSVLHAELDQTKAEVKQVVREQQLRRMKMLITRVCGERDRALVFRGWSRLCLHAASLSAAEGASAAATAVARAARAEAMEKEAQAAANKAEAWRRAAAASTEVAEAREKAQREAARESFITAELDQRIAEMEQVAREQKLRRMKMLITRVCGERDRALVFRGWSRLCLHAASLSAAEGASAAATAVARAARAEAMEKEAQAAADKAEAWRRAAAASTEVAEAREKAQREAAHGSVLHAELDQTKTEVKQVVREQQLRRMKMLITRVCSERDRALVFRGWSRLCLHAASLSAAEGASAAATAVARAARAEAMEKEAQAAPDKAEAWRRAAAASAEVAEAREKAQREAARESFITAELDQRIAEMEQVAREQKLRRMKMLGASAAATAVARAARAEAMEKEAQAAANKAEAWRRAAAASTEVAAAREKAQREAAHGSVLHAEENRRNEDMKQAIREQQLRRMKMLITRMCGERDRALIFRGWSRLCLHAASLSAAEGASAAATAVARAARAEAMEKEAKAAAASAEKEAAREAAQRAIVRGSTLATELKQKDRDTALMLRKEQLRRMKMLGASASATAVARAARAEAVEREAVAAANAAAEQMEGVDLHIELRTERETVARGWARLRAATAVSAAAADFAEGAEIKKNMETYAARRGRELDRKSRALAILLRGDWASTVLEREQETRAARLQLAECEADLTAQVDSMAGLAAASSSTRGRGAHDGKVSGQPGHAAGRGVTGSERPAGEEAEVFLGGAGEGIGMVALQGDGARRLRAYVAGKGRDLKRARVESQQWRARCEAMQRRLNMLTSGGGLEGTTSSAEGNRLAAILLNMLDERDHRLSSLYKDLASLSIVSYSDGFQPSRHQKGDRRRSARKRAGEILLRQMTAAGDEARTHIHRLSHEVQHLEASLRGVHVPALVSEQPEFNSGRRLPANGVSHLKGGAGQAGLLVEVSNTATHDGDHGYSAALVDDDGVQAAIDAHELIVSLRSEVSALERYSAALQTNLDRLKDASATTVNGAATAAAWIAFTTAPATSNGRGRGMIPASNHDPGAKLEVQGGGVATEPAVTGGTARKRVRAERRKHAAEVLRQVLGDGDESATPGVSVEGEEARAVMLARETRQRAQEAFVSRGMADA
ncbi:unnamed protein product [Pylaiella littoralis]